MRFAAVALKPVSQNGFAYGVSESFCVRCLSAACMPSGYCCVGILPVAGAAMRASLLIIAPVSCPM